MSFNMVSFMIKGQFETRFVSMSPNIVQWLNDNGYKPYYDDYSDIDCIFARSQIEYEAIHAYMVKNP